MKSLCFAIPLWRPEQIMYLNKRARAVRFHMVT